MNLEAVVVHLTGPFRGTRQHLFSDDISVGTGPDVDIRFPAERAPAVAPNHAALRKTTDGSYSLTVRPGETVFVNGAPAADLTLSSGDVLGLGENGPVLRFLLLRDAPTGHKSMSEALRDCVDGATYGSASRIWVDVWLFLKDLPRVNCSPRRLLPFGSRWPASPCSRWDPWRHWPCSVFDSNREFRRKDSESETSKPRSASRAEQISDPELQARFDELALALSTRVEALELLSDAGRRIVSTAEPSVVFLQGAYGWRAPDGRPLRIRTGT